MSQNVSVNGYNDIENPLPKKVKLHRLFGAARCRLLVVKCHCYPEKLNVKTKEETITWEKLR